MQFPWRVRPFPAALFVALLLLPLECAVRRTALDEYVAKPDPSFRYDLVRTIPDQEYTAYVLDMDSQRWRTLQEVDRTQWSHWIVIVRPNQVRHSTALLLITGGNNASPVPGRVDPAAAEIAVKTGSVVASVHMIPNQPLRFSGERRVRSEDALIAYTWDRYMETRDDTWPAQLPMAKSAVRAMDAVAGFLASPEGGRTKVDRFVLAGASKRGWTAWLTAAVDRRVTAIIPLVIDILNIEPSFLHHHRVYGFWAPAIRDYVEMGVMDRISTPELQSLLRIVDPYSYRDRFTMPKYIINATGDQFFVPDSWQFYFDDLPGEKYLRYVPNADHSLRSSDALESAAAYYAAILENRPRPRFQWRIDDYGTILVKPIDRPGEVKLWQATNPDARDFRLQTIGPAFRSTTLHPAADGSYAAQVPAPPRGHTAYFIELTYPSGTQYPFKFTTGVRVVSAGS